MEQYTRTKINTQLTNLGWLLDGHGKNVYQEEPRTTEEKKKLGKRRPDYILYASDRDRYEPIAIIEAKTPKKSGLDGALQQAEDYAHRLNAPIVFATNGIYCQTKHIRDSRSLLYNGEQVDGLLPEERVLKFLETHQVDTRPDQVKTDKAALINLFKQINKLLRKSGQSAGHERFSDFATLLFLKLFSERAKNAHYAPLPKPYTWGQLSTLTSKDLLNYVATTILPAITQRYQDKSLFEEPLRIADNAIFKQIYDRLDPLQLSYINEDVKGGAFEYFLAHAPSASKDLGEYFTPRHIVKAMVKLLDPQIGEKVYDPFCGTGGMLIESYRHIHSTMAPTEANRKALKKDTLYGREITSNTRIAKMNMILAGDGHNHIKQCDSLAPKNLQEVTGKFDVVITNPPFAQKTKHQAAYDLPVKNGDSICLQHCIQALKPGGRMAVIVPEGVLFRKDLQKTRAYLLHHCHLHHIISLPQGVFQPYTGVKTNILHATKKKHANERTGKVWFYQVKQDGFTLDARRRPLGQRSDLDRFISFCHVGEKDKPNFGFSAVDAAQIKAGGYSLRLHDYLPEERSTQRSWDGVDLGDICSLTNGFAFQSKRYTPSGIKLIKINNVQEGYINKDSFSFYQPSDKENLDRFFLQENDVLISLTGNIGRVALVTKDLLPALLNQRVGCIRIHDKKKIDAKYLFYLLNSHQFISWCSRFATGIAQKNLSTDQIKKIKIPLPPREEQERIVSEIANHEQIIQGAQQIMAYYKPRIEMQESWKKVKLGTIATCYQPQTITGREIKPSGKHKVYGANGVIGHYHTYNHKEEQVVVACRGICGAVNLTAPHSWIAGNAMVCAPKTHHILKRYLYYALSTIDMSRIITGSVQSQIIKSSMEGLTIPLPPLEEQQRIVAQMAQEEAAIQQVKTLHKLIKEKITKRIYALWTAEEATS